MAKPSLFIADADPRSLRILELALRKAGFAVETAMDGTQALQLVLAAPPDLLVCEASLPSQDGLSVCQQLRAALPALPIILVSADKSLAPRALEAGADEFLRKPILLRELVQRARALLEKRELLQGAKAASRRGSLRDLGLVDALQSLLAAKTSAAVSCEAYGRTARLWVRDGELVDAELGPLQGEAAFFRLMTWESGGYRVEPQVVEREARIEGGTEAALVEAMRRTEELGRASGELPMTSIFAVDSARLADHLADLPDEVNGVIRSFDGRRTLRESIDLSPVDDLESLLVVQRLLAGGILRAVESKKTALKPSLEEWLSDPPPPEAVSQPPPPPPPEDDKPLSLDAARVAAALVEEMAEAEILELQRDQAAEDAAAARVAHRALVQAPPLVRFPPLRGVRRERLRREAEEARQRIAAGEAVRLSRVVELPAYRPGGADALGPARWMSPAVGEAAKKFAPDAPVARLVNGESLPGATEAATQLSYRPQILASPVTEPPEPVTTPPIAPVAVVTPPIAALVPGTPPSQRGLEPAERVALGPRGRRWRSAAAALTAALVGVAFLLRRQPATDKKDAPWLEPVAAAKVLPLPPDGGAAKERAPRTEEPSLAPPSSGAEPPPAAAGPASDQLYKKALELGETQLRGGKYQEAIAHFRRAVKERPQGVPALLALGDAYLEADQPRSAVPPLESAARLDPRSARAQLLLGTAWQSLGKNAKALRAYRRYLELEPRGEFARDVRLILANLAH